MMPPFQHDPETQRAASQLTARILLVLIVLGFTLHGLWSAIGIALRWLFT